MSRKLILKTLIIDVPTAGIRVQISESKILAGFIRISPNKGNTNGIFIGDSAVDSTYKEINPTDASIEYWASQKGDYTEGPWFDLRDFYVDADTAGNDVIVEYYEIA